MDQYSAGERARGCRGISTVLVSIVDVVSVPYISVVDAVALFPRSNCCKLVYATITSWELQCDTGRYHIRTECVLSRSRKLRTKTSKKLGNILNCYTRTSSLQSVTNAAKTSQYAVKTFTLNVLPRNTTSRRGGLVSCVPPVTSPFLRRRILPLPRPPVLWFLAIRLPPHPVSRLPLPRS